jgi:outer membrane protein OmpA-like peptidoglycan-associated protein
MGEQIAADAQRITDAQANAILQYWRDRGAFGPGQLTARPAGVAQPIMDNQTPVGRATNRRIEFTLSGFR